MTGRTVDELTAEIVRVKDQIHEAKDNRMAADTTEERREWTAQIESLRDELADLQEELVLLEVPPRHFRSPQARS
jgi:hypothetical protein